MAVAVGLGGWSGDYAGPRGMLVAAPPTSASIHQVAPALLRAVRGASGVPSERVCVIFSWLPAVSASRSRFTALMTGIAESVADIPATSAHGRASII